MGWGEVGALCLMGWEAVGLMLLSDRNSVESFGKCEPTV